MRKTLLFALALGGCSVTFAQPIPPTAPQRDADAARTSAQKRSELLNVLSAGRRTETTAQVDPAEPTGHQLSERERAEMREQLRRYKPPGSDRGKRP